MVQVAGLIVYHSAGFCFIMPLGVVILNHAGGLHHHAAVLIAYQEAGTWFR